MEKRKILIVALAQSTHTHGWIDLIDQKKFEVRLFGLKNSRPGVPLSTFYYCLEENFPFVEREPNSFNWFNKFRRLLFYLDYFNKFKIENWWLKKIINAWKPDVIHTLGLDPAAYRFLPVLRKIKKNFKWVVTIRGGSDLELDRFDKEKTNTFKNIFNQSDFAIADNPVTYQYAFKLGLAKNKKPNWDFVPGAGGMDIEKLSKLRKIKTTRSHLILWPKACEATYSKGLPVLEAIKLAWPKIKPCEFVMTAVDDDFQKWLKVVLPLEIQKNIKTFDRIPRHQLLQIMANARVALLPSLVDGIPNSLYEAMAAKVVPIVSPIVTIKSVFCSKNVLFARNLYPHEIAKALIKAMTDDNFVDKIVVDNLRLVKELADQKKIAKKVNEFYEVI